MIVSASDNIRNIKCIRPDIDAIYQYFPKTVATNVDGNYCHNIISPPFLLGEGRGEQSSVPSFEKGGS